MANPSFPPLPRMIVALVLAVAAGLARTEPLIINTGFTPPVSTLFGDILEEVGRRIGRDIVFQQLSAERSLVLVNEGIDDGECCRIPGVVLKDYPNLVRVPESVFRVKFVAFSKDPRHRVQRWHDLKPYHVATVTGWKIQVKNIERVQPASFTMLDTAEAMFRMLELGRIDIATLGLLSGLDVIRRLGLEDIRALEPPLAERDLYLLLHRRHTPLVPRINQTLRAMKADGTMDRLVAAVIPGDGPAAARGRGGR